MNRRVIAAVLGLAVPGCGDPADPSGTPDGGPAGDAAPGCVEPALDGAWLPPLLTGAVSSLAAAPRATTTQRSAARAYLSAQLAADGWTPTEHVFSGGINILATIPATVPASAEGLPVIVGAHFDTVAGSPGANDNASGTAVVLAVARALADTPCRARAVTVILFDQEEVGLFGSSAYAQTRAPAQVHSVHTIDQVSWDGDGDRVFELELPTPALEAVWRAAASTIGVSVTTTTTEGTDHEPFRDRGFAAVGLTEEYVGGDTSPHRHLASDTPATVDATYLTLAAQLTLRVVLDTVRP